MNIDLEKFQKELFKVSDDYDKGIGLEIHQRVAREIIRSERSYFYGDRNSTGRARDMRNIIEDGFKALLKEEINDN